MIIPGYILAGLWGAAGSFALLIGGFFGYKYNISKRVIAIITAFSSGILISAVCFELLFEAYEYGNLDIIAIGFTIGVVAFTLIDALINRFSIKKHKEIYNIDLSENKDYIDKYTTPKLKKGVEKAKKNNGGLDFITSKYKHYHYFNKYQVEGLTTFAGALLDGIPESIAIGLIFFIGGPISVALLIAVFTANLFEGLSASLHMKIGGWKSKSVLGMWVSVVILTGVSAMLSYIIFSFTDQHILSGALSVSAGGILAMLSSTMLPEAFKETKEYTGLILAMGFLLSFILSHLAVH